MPSRPRPYARTPVRSFSQDDAFYHPAVLEAIPLLFIISVVLFVLMSNMGDPLATMGGRDADARGRPRSA